MCLTIQLYTTMNTQISPSLSLICGQFCASLRRRAIWNVIGPVLTASTLGLEGVWTALIPLPNYVPDNCSRKRTAKLRSQLPVAVLLVAPENSSPQPILYSSYGQRKHVVSVD